MVLLPSLLFVRRKRYQQDNESLPVQDEDKHEENIKTIKNNKTKFPKIYKKKNNKQYQTDQQYNNKERITYGKSKRIKLRKSSLNNPKRIILHLTVLKNKTEKLFNRIFRRKCKLKKSFKTHLCQQFQKDSFKFSNIYGLSKTNTISIVNTKNAFNTEDLLSGGTSTTDIWNEEWEITPTVCAKRQSFVFEDNLETNNENINNLYCDWSRDSVFCSDSESEDFYSAVESQRESPVSERLLIINNENSEDEEYDDDDLKSKENENNGLNIFLESGYTVKELLEMGCDVKDLVVAGCSVEELLKSGCSVKDLLKSGCKVMDILAHIDDEQILLNSGYSVQELVEYKSRVEELLEPKPEKRQELKRRLAAGEELYPTCDVSIWLRSCREEILKPLSGVTTGIIPKWLKGTLLRNGPGSLIVGNDQFEHLFDGSALIHRFGIENGEVRYQCKFVETNTFKKNHAAQRIVVTEFGTAGVPDPCQSIFQRISVLFNPGETLSDNAMISVYPFGDEFYAFAENSVIHRIDPSTLESTGRVSVSKHVDIVNHTSHPHVLDDGSVYNVGISIRCTGPHYSVVKFPPALYTDVNGIKSQVRSPFEQAQIVASVPARWKFNPSYMHTFGITDNYFVIVEQPLSVSFTTLFKRHLKNQPMAPSLKWHKNEQTRIHLLNRKTGEPVAKFLADAFFFLHIINQYEAKNHLVLDISCYKDAKMLDCMYINALKQANQNLNYAEMFRGRPLRFVLPLTSSDEGSWGTNLVTLPGSKATAYRFMDNNIFVCPELICDLGCETPRIYYEKHLGKPYRYFYAISSDVDLDNPGTLIKVDTVKKTTKTWCEDNVFPSEPVFVPSPETKSEDDGVVLSAMVWTKGMENKVGLLVLDAVTWTELGRTVFVTPSPVPKCLHGWFTDYCS